MHRTLGGNSVADKRIDFTYNVLGQFDIITRYASLDTSEKVAVTDYDYDNLARLDSLLHTDGAGTPTTLASYTWTFDTLNRVEQFVSTDGTVDYTYDANHQLIATDSTYDTDEQYVYDLNGNRALATNDTGTNAEYLTGLNNYLLSDGTFAYTYDAEGNRTARFKDIDSDGAISSGDTDITEYTWDHRNRLVKVTEKSSISTTTAIYEYVYDVFNRRIEKRLDTNGDLTVDQTERFVLDGEHIALVFDGSNNLTNRYLHGPAIDQILADEDAAGDVLWPLADNLGSVRDLAEYDSSTNATTIANHIIYDSYGNVTSETDDTVDHRFAFTGRERDEETNLQYHRRRYFDPRAGNWLNPDPDGFSAGDSNLGRYVNNSPTNATDPSGLDGLDIGGIIPPEPDSGYGLGGSGLGPNPGDPSFGGGLGGMDDPLGLGGGDAEMPFPLMEDIARAEAAREAELANRLPAPTDLNGKTVKPSGQPSDSTNLSDLGRILFDISDGSLEAYIEAGEIAAAIEATWHHEVVSIPRTGVSLILGGYYWLRIELG